MAVTAALSYTPAGYDHRVVQAMPDINVSAHRLQAGNG